VSLRFKTDFFEEKILNYGFRLWLNLILEEEQEEEDIF